MVWASTHTHIAATIFLFLYLLQPTPVTPTVNLLVGVTHLAMVLSLYQFPPNILRSSFLNCCRHLQRFTSRSYTSSRMQLYDDLLLNRYYTTRLWFVTPPQQFAINVETRSTITYVPCATCEQYSRHQGTIFYKRQDAERSSSSGVHSHYEMVGWILAGMLWFLMIDIHSKHGLCSSRPSVQTTLCDSQIAASLKPEDCLLRENLLGC